MPPKAKLLATKKVTLIIPSLRAGGAERVMALLANDFVNKVEQVNLVSLTQSQHFYQLDPRIKVYEPIFNVEKLGKIRFTLQNFFWLRAFWSQVNSDAALSFGGKYNAFVLLTTIGKKQKVFVSDRSRPSISYGRFLDFLNPLVYRKARGIVAQTDRAKALLQNSTRHPNIKVIANPVTQIPESKLKREKVILNVGRFISSKHQDWLIQYFEEIEDQSWVLRFLGDGPNLDKIKTMAANSPKSKQIEFLGSVDPIVPFYQNAGIFAFTSTSEGFPNALGEAMSAGCPVISFDCEAGPADMIKEGVNGYLVEVGNHQDYKEKLQSLISNVELRESFGLAARQKMQDFEVSKICSNYLNFLLAS